MNKITSYLSQQSNLDTLRFIACGSVDDGKSTLIGRILYECNQIFEDQLKQIEITAKQSKITNKKYDFSLALDGLSAEQEQKITIDVAYRFFSTKLRKFIVADTPGHEQYTKNMVTGASTARLAILIIDAQKGILNQSRRHAMICSLLGIKHIVLAINKMDLVNYKQNIYKKIADQFKKISTNLKFEKVQVIPVSALSGDNIILNSQKMKWYKGPVLLEYLEKINTYSNSNTSSFYFPVQWVNRPNQNFRGYSGNIISGKIKVNQDIKVYPSMKTAKVKKIFLYKKKLKQGILGQSLTLTLDKEIDISKGNIILSKNSKYTSSSLFNVNIVWLDQENGYPTKRYMIKIGTDNLFANIIEIKNIINIKNLEPIPGKKLTENDIANVVIKLNQEILFEPYEKLKELGSFILIDPITKRTIAAGMINFSLYRSKNICRSNFEILKKNRQNLSGHKSKVLWLTGISGSGKSTIANTFEKHLFDQGIRTYILDGDNLRLGINKDLGFTKTDRIENIRRIGEISKLMVDAGIVVLVSVISPYEFERKLVRDIFEKDEFIEIFVKVSLKTAESRDPKGLYKKARNGEIPNFTGISSKYEKPRNPEIILDTDKLSIEKILQKLIKKVHF